MKLYKALFAPPLRIRIDWRDEIGDLFGFNIFLFSILHKATHLLELLGDQVFQRFDIHKKASLQSIVPPRTRGLSPRLIHEAIIALGAIATINQLKVFLAESNILDSGILRLLSGIRRG